MRVLVIGGTGRLGPFVLRELIARGHEVTIIHRGVHPRPKEITVHEIVGDRRNASAFRQALESTDVEAVIDLFPARADDTRIVVEAFAGRIRTSVHIGAFDVYEQYVGVDIFSAWEVPLAYRRVLASRPIPIREDAPLRTHHIYPHPQIVGGFDKIFIERELEQAREEKDFPSTMLRLAAIYGPQGYSLEDPRLREWYFVKRVLDGRKQIAIPGSGAGLLHRVHYANASRAVVLALESPSAIGKAYNVGDTQHFTVRQIAEQVAIALGHEWEIVPVPRPWVRGCHDLDADPPFLLDLTKIREEMGYRDVLSAEEGLRQTVDYLVKNRPGSKHRYFDYEAEDAIIERAARTL